MLAGGGSRACTAMRSYSDTLDPGDEPGWISPESLDFLLPDIDECVLRTAVAESLGVKYLASAALTDQRFPVSGVIFGRLPRIMVSLVVYRHAVGRAVNVIFVVSTGSPYTFCAPAVFAALGVTDSLPKGLQLNVQGVDISVSPSHAHFADANVLGQDFFAAGGVDLAVLSSRRVVHLLRPRRRQMSGD